jgi:exodeoxyribonuclease X
MLLAVMDTETTGIDEQDQVVEIAGIAVRQSESGPLTSFEAGHWETLIQPTVPITIGARATHHITDEELKTAPGPKETMETLGEMLRDEEGDETVTVFHNAEFDLRLLRQTCWAVDLVYHTIIPARYICTWVCAKHIYPDSPGHSNQVLRYYLGLDELYGSLTIPGVPPHRAMPDALVTSRLLMHMLRTKTPEELILLTQTPVLQTYCRMPKHAGKTWEEVARIDPSYCHWMLAQGPEVKLPAGGKTGFDADTIHTLKFHLGLL